MDQKLGIGDLSPAVSRALLVEESALEVVLTELALDKVAVVAVFPPCWELALVVGAMEPDLE